MRNVILIILDGWGLSKERTGNPILQAKTPNIDFLISHYPFTKLSAHGKYVGLPGNQDGSSEAGHLNLGAGRIVQQDSVEILKSIKNGTFFKNTAFLEAIKHLKKYKTKLHLMGLLSGKESPHSFPEHIYALLELARSKGIQPVILHLFTDGRDSSQHGAIKFLKKLRKEFKNGEIIGSIIGRFYAMDRKENWSNIEKVYDLLTIGKGKKVKSAEEAISMAYNRGITDEFISPFCIVKNGKPVGIVNDNDAVIYFNLRSDRARELTKAFAQKNFNKLNPGSFRRKRIPKNTRFVTMTNFGPELPRVLTAFASSDIKNSLPAVLKKFSQVYLAESEKYAHITYFFNGGYANPVGGEERIKIPSPNVVHYDEVPKMSALKIVKVVKKKIKSKKYNFICVNFANPDMIGHTGNLKAGIKCCEIMDKCVKDLADTALKNKFTLIITADHGNIEEMINIKTGEIDTKHSKNLVPFILVSPDKKSKKIKFKNGVLGNVAPTILKIMGIPKPKEMVKKSLI